MKTAILVLHLLISAGLIGLILIQSGKGGGLGQAFGSGEFFRSKRGAEKMLFTGTIITAGLFLITSILSLVVV